MIEFIFVGSALFSVFVVLVVGVISALLRSGSYFRACDRIKHAPYGTICLKCQHMIDMLDAKSIASYDQGLCPSCGTQLMKLETQ